MFEKLKDKVADWTTGKVMQDLKVKAVAGTDGVVIQCDCGQKNRVPFSALGKTGKCGQCSEPLPTTEFPVDVGTSGVLSSMANESPIPIVVDFWSPTCGPCVIGLPRVEEAAQKSAGNYVMVRINLQTAPMASRGYNVQAIPTMVRLEKGKETGRVVGLHSTDQIIAFGNT